MQVKVLFFGELAELVQQELFVDNLESSKEVEAYLLEIYPLLAKKTYRMAVNTKIADENTRLQEGDVLVFLPPFAGG